MSNSGWRWHNLGNLLTINLRNKFSLNFIDWSWLYLQVYIPPVHVLKYIFVCKSRNISRCTVFRLIKNIFSKPPYTWHDLIINPHAEQQHLSQVFPKKFVHPSFIIHTTPKNRVLISQKTRSVIIYIYIYIYICIRKFNSILKN